MKTPTKVQSNLSNRLNQQVQNLLQAPACTECGVIIAQVHKMGPVELQDLETRLGMENASMTAISSYEEWEKALVILLPGQTLAYAHFLSLSVKDYLQGAELLTGKMGVAGFPESAEPSEATMAEFLTLVMGEPDSAGQDISVYSRQANVNEAPSIVMIDQNTDLLDFMQARLGHQGYDVRPAQDGREGLNLINETPPDIVITELTLPALDGYQLIHRIQQSKELRNHCKIMVLTDLGLEHEVSKCFDLGVSDVVKKPFSPVELEARIRRLLA
ncbi:response regulator transcription factor [Paenibacillus xerothermodurans]|uniref:Response regulator n=1 Tax=Paenibacillus xerothermodurans TaxID=1977292 RepID=A0A2W1N6Z1_PAEXE|nr:response regulator transcription factor [Paenibacillus xerothermodurans]PZE19594.1 response regulator [Paenibacillus xerothermodurans]